MCQKEHVQGMECAAFQDSDRRGGRDEGRAGAKRAKKNTSKAGNAQHSMIPKRREGRDEGHAQWHTPDGK